MSSRKTIAEVPRAAELFDHYKNAPRTLRDFTPGSHAKIWWKCEFGHSFDAVVNKIAARGTCPVCSGKRLVAGINDLETLRPDIAKDWAPENSPLKPSDFSPGSKKKVAWLCSKGHLYDAQICNRTAIKSTGCPYCAGQKVLEGFNDMATTRPDLALEFDSSRNAPLTPETIVAGSSKKLWWLCAEGHSFQQFGYSRVAGAGCPFCAGKAVLAGISDLASTHPALINEWDFERNTVLPTEVSAGSHTRVYWVCKSGHNWSAVLSSRATRGLGCAQCAGQKVSEGETDLASTHPNLLAEWDFEKNTVSPHKVIAGTNQKLHWICSACGWKWSATGNKRALYGQGCPMCQVGGFQISRPSVLYFLRHEKFKARKVGITNLDANPDRLKGFQAEGWIIVRRWDRSNGVPVKKAETALLRWIRKELNMPPFLSRAEMGHAGGWSETFSLEGPSDEEVIAVAEASLD